MKIGENYRVLDRTSVYHGMVGKCWYEIAGQWMIAFPRQANGDRDCRAYLESELELVDRDLEVAQGLATRTPEEVIEQRPTHPTRRTEAQEIAEMQRWSQLREFRLLK